MIPATHPVVRAMAGEMALDLYGTLSDVTICDVTLTAPLPAEWAVAGLAALLTDLTRPASRDAWVRWLEDHLYPALIGPHERMSSREMDVAAAERAHALRDNPEALTAAVCAALETM